MDVIEGLLHRVDQTLTQSVGRYPAYADPVTGTWTWSTQGGWLAGFWPGLLSLTSAATGRSRYAHAAADCLDQLKSRTDAPTVLRGFVFWYSAGVAKMLGQGTGGEELIAIEAARSMGATFDEAGKVLPPGREDAHLYGWPRSGACVDSLPGSVRLLAYAAQQTADPDLGLLALAHARGVARLCVRSDGSVAQAATYDALGDVTSRTSINGSSPDSTWSRGQAWAMLGLAQAANVSAEFIQPATQVADWYLDHALDDLLCYWDFDDPEIPRAPLDTSAAAVAAAALLKLAPLLTAGRTRYVSAARSIVESLSSGHVNVFGALIDGCYNRPKEIAVGFELIWGDYYLLEAALALDGRIDSAML
ncbi:MAG: putative unsaturated glucuronyl hydrolase [Frankiales bacterium]|nr:putative unsaturated glucuronyl hydrolase [Frankiales bacterium]